MCTPSWFFCQLFCKYFKLPAYTLCSSIWILTCSFDNGNTSRFSCSQSRHLVGSKRYAVTPHDWKDGFATSTTGCQTDQAGRSIKYLTLELRFYCNPALRNPPLHHPSLIQNCMTKSNYPTESLWDFFRVPCLVFDVGCFTLLQSWRVIGFRA